MKQIILMDRPALERTLHRMAIQIWEQAGQNKDIVIIGLNERGFATANLLASYLNKLSEIRIALHQYDVKKADKNQLPACNGKYVVLVDDVTFSGKTMFQALSHLCSLYEPAKIEIAALLDRGHRTYPINTGLKGRIVPTKLGEHIEVMLDKGQLQQAILFKN